MRAAPSVASRNAAHVGIFDRRRADTPAPDVQYGFLLSSTPISIELTTSLQRLERRAVSSRRVPIRWTLAVRLMIIAATNTIAVRTGCGPLVFCPAPGSGRHEMRIRLQKSIQGIDRDHIGILVSRRHCDARRHSVGADVRDARNSGSRDCAEDAVGRARPAGHLDRRNRHAVPALAEIREPGILHRGAAGGIRPHTVRSARSRQPRRARQRARRLRRVQRRVGRVEAHRLPHVADRRSAGRPDSGDDAGGAEDRQRRPRLPPRADAGDADLQDRGAGMCRRQVRSRRRRREARSFRRATTPRA